MITSETLTKLLPALLAAKKQFKPALKTTLNPHFGKKYVDLDGVHEATEEALLANELLVLQTPGTYVGDPGDKNVAVTTRLLHTSGEWIQDTLTIPAGNANRYDAQTVGSAITYARRYSYMGILGIAPEDDDGNVASAHAGPQTAKPAFKPNGKPAPRYDRAHDDGETKPNGRTYDISEYTDDPVFVDGDMVPATKVPPPAPPRYEPPSVKPASGPTITKAQAKRFFLKCKATEKTEAEIKAVLGAIKVQRSLDIPKDQYEAFCDWADQVVPA